MPGRQYFYWSDLQQQKQHQWQTNGIITESIATAPTRDIAAVGERSRNRRNSSSKISNSSARNACYIVDGGSHYRNISNASFIVCQQDKQPLMALSARRVVVQLRAGGRHNPSDPNDSIARPPSAVWLLPRPDLCALLFLPLPKHQSWPKQRATWPRARTG